MEKIFGILPIWIVALAAVYYFGVHKKKVNN